jgi:hypothetical protein
VRPLCLLIAPREYLGLIRMIRYVHHSGRTRSFRIQIELTKTPKPRKFGVTSPQLIRVSRCQLESTNLGFVSVQGPEIEKNAPQHSGTRLHLPRNPSHSCGPAFLDQQLLIARRSAEAYLITASGPAIQRITTSPITRLSPAR